MSLQEESISELVIAASGRERLRWGNQGAGRDSTDAVANLPAGSSIDLHCPVRYGFAAGD